MARWLVVIVCGALVILSIYGATPAKSAEQTTLTPEAYLPFIGRQPTMTPTPTATTIPTSTMEPTPTSTPTALPGVYVLPNHGAWGIYGSSEHIVGEVQNNTDYYLRFVKVTAHLMGSSGQVLATDYGYAYLDSLPPHEKACFVVLFLNPPIYSYATFDAVDYMTGGDPPPPLVPQGTTGFVENSHYHLTGKVLNNGSQLWRYISPIATFYDSTGKVVDCDFTYANPSQLPSGGTASFTIDSYTTRYQEVRSYRVQVDAMK